MFRDDNVAKALTLAIGQEKVPLVLNLMPEMELGRRMKTEAGIVRMEQVAELPLLPYRTFAPW